MIDMSVNGSAAGPALLDQMIREGSRKWPIHSPHFGATDEDREAAYACLRDLRAFGREPLMWVRYDGVGWCIAYHADGRRDIGLMTLVVRMWQSARALGQAQGLRWADDKVREMLLNLGAEKGEAKCTPLS